jgi:hypothetical protein
MTSVIAMMRSSLQALTSSAGGQFVAFIYKGRGASGKPLCGQRLWVIDLIVDGFGEEIKISW